MSRAGSVALIGAVVLASVGGWWLQQRYFAAPSAVADHAVSVAASASGGSVTPHAAYSDSPPTAKAATRDARQVLQDGTLRGTAPDGDVHLGFGGHLKPDMALRRLFDYYLAMIGETDLKGIRQLLADELTRRKIDPLVRDEVMQDFARYVDYQQALPALAQQAGVSMPTLIAQTDRLRDDRLGPELATAFYGEDRINEQRLLKRLAINNDPTLTPQQKQLALQQLDSTLPPSERLQQQQTVVAATVQQQTEQLDASGADSAERYRVRADQWGPQAATQLQALDQQRAQWQSRLDAFTQQSNAVRSDNSLTPDQRTSALQDLLNQNFQGTERLQVQSMQQAGMLGGS